MRRRRRAAPDEPGISLFPFVAVLLCTMGALILVLLLVSQRAKAQSHQDEPDAELDLARLDRQARDELLEFRVEQLRSQRQATLRDLEHRRLELGQIESHMRALENELAQLQAGWASDAPGRPAADAAADAVAEELAALEARLDRRRRELAEAQQQHAQRRASFAVVPYQGNHGTHRRPIYIECRRDAIVLQPEGVVFTVQDFEGPLGPGNPLAAAVRAARDHLLAVGGSVSDVGEPYPLLLVRPDGVVAYGAARAALKSWDSDFGYELIDGDWDLAFQQPDQRLGQLAQKAADEARIRQEMLVRAAPRVYGRPRRGGSQAAGAGSFAEAVGQTWSAEGSAHDASAGDRGTAGTGARDPGRLAQSSSGGRADEGDAFAAAAGDAAVGRGRREGPLAPAGPGDGAVAGDGDPAAPWPERAAEEDARLLPHGLDSSPGAAAAAGPGAAAGADQRLAAAGRPANANRDAKSGSPGGAWAAEPDGSPEGEPDSRQRPGRDSPGETLGPAGSAADGSDAPAHSAGTSALGAAAASAAAGTTPNLNLSPPRSAASLATRRGANWGLPDATANAVPITRPIRLECRADCLRLLPSTFRSHAVREIALGARTEDAVDELVSAIWEQMKGWGMAGNNMYWKPVLSVDVAPEADARFAELETLLDNSGLEIRRRAAADGTAGPSRAATRSPAPRSPARGIFRPQRVP